MFSTIKMTDKIVCVYLFIGTLIFYGINLPSWWISSDDTFILKYVAEQKLWETFIIPDVWLKFSGNNLTPWVCLLYKIDLWLFHLNPYLFYVHHLVMAALLSVVLYIFLRQWISWFPAASGAALFSLSPSYLNCINYLMTRHYVEGLFWSLLAIIFFILSLKKQKKKFSYIGAFCFLIAVLNKEIYAPLIILLPFITVKNDQKKISYRILSLLPFIIVAGGYALYRKWMLGGWIGGYGSLYSLTFDFVTIIKNMNFLLFDECRWLAPFTLFLSIFGIYRNFITTRNKLQYSAFVVCVLIAISVPIIGALAVLSRRHLFLLAMVLISTSVFGVFQIWKAGYKWRFVAIGSVLIMFAGMIQSHGYLLDELKELQAGYTEQGKFLWEKAGKNDAVFLYNIPQWYVDSLFWLKGHFKKEQDRPIIIMDFCNRAYFSTNWPEDVEYWGYDTDSQVVVNRRFNTIKQDIANCKNSFRNDISIQVHMWQNENSIAWEFGPYTNGTYQLVNQDSGAVRNLPPSGHVPGKVINIENLTKLFVCYKDAQGWAVCSSLIQNIIK